jgi:hypothetical protein
MSSGWMPAPAWIWRRRHWDRVSPSRWASWANASASAGVTGDLDLADTDARLVGEAEEDHAGGSMSGARDVDADSHDDRLVGATTGDLGRTDRVGAYLVLGPVAGDRSLADTDVRLSGEAEQDAAG